MRLAVLNFVTSLGHISSLKYGANLEITQYAHKKLSFQLELGRPYLLFEKF